MQAHWLSILFQAVFTIAGIALVMRWLGRSRLRARPPADTRLLVQPPGILAIGIIGAVFFAGMIAAALVWADGSEGALFYPVMGGFVLVSLYLIADVYIARHEVGDEGMLAGRVFAPDTRFAWRDVAHVDFNALANWYRIRLHNGVTVRIGGTLLGLPEFARVLLQHVPATRIELATRKMLDDAAKGKLHPLSL